MKDGGVDAIRKIFECRWLACTKAHDGTIKDVQAVPQKQGSQGDRAGGWEQHDTKTGLSPIQAKAS